MIFHQKYNSVTPYNVNIFTYTDKRFLPHFHKDLELLFVLDGDCLITIEGKTKLLKKGEFCLILSGQAHSFEIKDNSKVWVCVFANDYVKSFAEFIRGKTADNYFDFNKTLKDYIINEFILKTLFEPLAENIDGIKSSAENLDDLLKYSGFFNLILSEYVKQVQFSNIEKNNFDLYRKITEYVSENFKKNISLDSLAEFLGYEKHYISRYFNKCFNTNFKKFINEYRIGFAEELLKHDTFSITDVAYKSGFGSVRSFNRVFKEINGYVPSKIKNISR